jgi:hypothetical protein
LTSIAPWWFGKPPLANQLQPKAQIEVAAVVFAAAGTTGDCAAHAADSRKFLTTIRAAIDEPRGISSRRKRQIVTTLLVGDSHVHTGLPPFDPVRQNLSLAGAKLGEYMRQLMPQSPVDLGRMLD